MGRAVDRLRDLNTRLAVPPELEALRPPAEGAKDLDKKEISRQQVGTGAGNNRSSQDMSSLFDQELQRQQQTNYEDAEVDGRKARSQRGDAREDQRTWPRGRTSSPSASVIWRRPARK